MARKSDFSTEQLQEIIQNYLDDKGMYILLRFSDLSKYANSNLRINTNPKHFINNPEIKKFVIDFNDWLRKQYELPKSVRELLNMDMDIAEMAELCQSKKNAIKILRQIDDEIQSLATHYNELVLAGKKRDDRLAEKDKEKEAIKNRIAEIEETVEKLREENAELREKNIKLKKDILTLRQDLEGSYKYIKRYLYDDIVRAHYAELGVMLSENQQKESELPDSYRDLFIRQGDDVNLVIREVVKSKIKTMVYDFDKGEVSDTRIQSAKDSSNNKLIELGDRLGKI